LVEQNINLLRRQLTKEEQLRVDGTCSENELRRKGLCFIYKEPWGLDNSCLSDIGGMAEVDQGGLILTFQMRIVLKSINRHVVMMAAVVICITI